MDAILERARAAGARPQHIRALLRAWLAGSDVAPRFRKQRPSRRLLAELPDLRRELEARAVLLGEHPSEDGSRRLLVGLADGATVETVVLQRRALCISTQVGCAVACRFCQTGRGGLQRQLGAGEILGQVALAQRLLLAQGLAPVQRVLLMGMGEPAHNLEAVLESLRWLSEAGRLSHKHLVFSTVGEPRVFARLLAHPVRPALALSLHTTHAELRAQLLPRAPRVDPAELLQAACDYARAVTWPLQVQWTLLAGVNDGDDEVERLATLLTGQLAIVNLIPWNTVEGLSYGRPDGSRSRDMVRALKARGVRATIRRSNGQDVEGGCGQLRARAMAGGSVPGRGSFPGPGDVLDAALA